MEQRTSRIQHRSTLRVERHPEEHPFLVQPSRLGLLAALLLTLTTFAQAQNTDSLKQRLHHLLLLHQQQQLSDSAYLKSVDSVVEFLYTDNNLEQWLEPYRQIAFASESLARYQAYYYRHLITLAENKNRNGTAIYYSEKNNAASVKAGLFEKDEIPHSDLYAISVFLTNRDYPRIFAKYDTLRSLCHAMPGDMVAGKKNATPDGVSMVFAVVDIMADAALKTRDSARLQEALHLNEKMLLEAQRQARKYASYMTYYNYIYHSSCLYNALYRKQPEEARHWLQVCLKEVQASDFGEANYPDGYMVDMFGYAFRFYFDQEQPDSARYFLQRIKAKIKPGGEYTSERLASYLEGISKLDAREGRFDSAYANLVKAYDLRGEAYYSVSADKDNNLYALAKAEDTYNDLVKAEAKRKRAEYFNILLFAALGLLLLGGLTSFFIYRAKQKRRMLNWQLGLARNFHDEIGPMVLYASTLARKELETHQSERLEELKGQMKQIMETVRGIAIDLKSNRLNTIHDFYAEINALLERIKASTQIDFNSGIQNGNAVLSHLQYDNLKKIISELITNSIKHADCTLLTFQLRVKDRNLRISYSDNGKGIPEEQFSSESAPASLAGTHKPGGTRNPVPGIGLQNIRERVELLRGKCQWNNYYPEGYSVTIIIPLL